MLQKKGADYMTELYHLHLIGNRDDKWKENKEIIIDDSFINRLGKKVNSFNDCTTNPQLDNISNSLNTIFKYSGITSFSKMPLHLILDFVLDPRNNIDQKTQLEVLKEVRNLTFQAAIFKRETAMENYRRDNNKNLPSRQHCIYVTTEHGIKYWLDRITDGNIDIFRIDALDEPFKTSEIFIPDESSNYKEMYDGSFRYWNPKFKNIPEETSEYLVKGKIKVLEKVDEIRR